MSYSKNIELDKEWARCVLQQMGMVKWKANTKANLEDFDVLKQFFSMDIKVQLASYTH